MILYLALFATAVVACWIADCYFSEERLFDMTAMERDARMQDPEEERAYLARSRDGFDVVFRGYRMDQVDAKIAQLQERIRHLESAAQKA